MTTDNAVRGISAIRRTSLAAGEMAVIDDLFATLLADPAFARFGSGRSTDSHLRARQLLVDQMGELTGGPCHYIGRDMKTSHAGLVISAEEWDANMRYADAALTKNGVAETERSEFLALFEQYCRDVAKIDKASILFNYGL